jgi:glycosyltransferase involved in cell wall biosynthesis
VKAALITADFFPHVGGQESRFLAIALRLRELGHDVDVMCIGYGSGLAPEETVHGVRIHRHPVLADRPPRARRFGSRLLARAERAVVVQTRFVSAIRRRLKEEHFDLIYLNQYPLVHILALPRWARRRAAIDWCEMRADFPHPMAQRWLPKMVAANFCVQEQMAGELAALAGRPVHYLPSGAYVSRYRRLPPSERAGWLFLGRWYANKQVPLLVKAWASYRANGGTGHLTLVGSGPDEGAVRAAISELDYRLRDDVSLPGVVSEDTKLGLLASSRLLVLTSNREGFPNVIVEAMASGLPVITVNEPLNGARHVVERTGIGLVTEPWPEAFAAGAQEVERDWDSYSQRALDHAAAHDWSSLLDRLLDLLAPIAA